MPLGKEGGPERTRGKAVEVERVVFCQLADGFGCRQQIIRSPLAVASRSSAPRLLSPADHPL
ncbi:MAG: hypothetical protein QF593_03405, partial [Nitrospinota bacterium]|nr:hypothetical protein [Nitrospinota bacterium]